MPSTSHLSLKDRRRRLEYAARVSALAMEAPDVETKKIVYTACRIIEKRFGFSRDEKKTLLLKLIEVGAASIAELINESRFHRDDVYTLVSELLAENKIREQWLNSTGGNGRSSARYFPADLD
jgi:hypothetical protein